MDDGISILIDEESKLSAFDGHKIVSQHNKKLKWCDVIYWFCRAHNKYSCMHKSGSDKENQRGEEAWELWMNYW